jgi:carboxyl-terminal processing protease
MGRSRTSPASWRSLLTGLLVTALLLVPLQQAPHASAADASLVIAALHVLEQQYVDPVQPVPLLNAAIDTLRKATKSRSDTLPDIAPGTPEAEATAQFSSEYSRAEQTGVVPEPQLAYLTTEGMLSSLHDSHTHFLTPEQLREERKQLFGNPVFTGIGVTITERKDTAGVGWIFVEDVFPGSPAEASGVHRFDRIVQVDGKSLRNVDVVAASQLIRGPAGSTAQLVVQRDNRTLPISVVRAAIRIIPVETRWLRPGVAYVKIFGFSQGAGADVRQGLEQLANEGTIRSIVLDLRGNPGGLIVEASSVGGVFLPANTVLARIHERGEEPSILRTSGAPLFPNTPLVVLTDGLSASASEILTGAFKDYQRATIVGEKTAGALGGSVTVALPEGGMSVTVERILTPKNEQVEGVGITPDVPVTLTVADMERGQDTQLEAALHALGQARMWPRVAAA